MNIPNLSIMQDTYYQKTIKNYLIHPFSSESGIAAQPTGARDNNCQNDFIEVSVIILFRLV